MARLIEADLLVQYLASRKCECVDDVGKSWNYGIDTAIRVVDQCITIDAEPVRHGHWIDAEVVGVDQPTVRCSICGIRFCDLINNHRFMYKYCPHCGAKMDEDFKE